MERFEKIIKNKIAFYALLCCFIILMILFIVSLCPKEMQNDTFWSIKVGEKLVKEGVWEIDDFSIHQGLKYVAHHFLTDIVIYFVYLIGDFHGLYVLEIILAIIMAVFLYVLNKEICNNKLISYFVLVCQLLLLSRFIALRAQMFSYILFIIELIMLEKSRRENKKWQYIILALIPIILANFHMGVVPFYFVLLGVYVIDCVKIEFLAFKINTNYNKKRLKILLVVFLIGLISIFINPYGIDGVVYPFKTFGNDFINGYIQEFQPFSMKSYQSIFVIIYIFLTIIVFIYNKTKVELKDILLYLGTLFMAFTAYRYIGLYVICSVVIIKYLKNILETININKADIYSLVGAGMTVVAIFVGINLDSKSNEYVNEHLAPKKAIEYIKNNISSNKVIYNEYEWGGYMILQNIPVFIDSRCDLYTKEYNEHINIAEDFLDINLVNDNYWEIIEKYDIDVFLISSDGILRRVLDERNEYINVYEDDIATIFVSNE